MKRPRISIIIPAYNAAGTIGACLEAVCAHADEDTEVIVTDDGSKDGTADIAGRFPCRLVRLDRNRGASAARNAGADVATGAFLFFTDADCIIQPGTLPRIRRDLERYPPDTVIGGTYTPVPHDPGLFSTFQSVFINYSECRNADRPDYIAAHALVVRAGVFRRIGSFREDFLPILEDVEFCHRLRRAGYRMVVDPGFEVQHVFGFTLARSLRNAFRKSRYWTEYSLRNGDLLADSGTASRELKLNGANWLTTAALAVGGLFAGRMDVLAPLPLIWLLNGWANRGLLRALHRAGGTGLTVMAGAYYALIYPAALWAGFFRGAVSGFTPRALREGAAAQGR